MTPCQHHTSLPRDHCDHLLCALLLGHSSGTRPQTRPSVYSRGRFRQKYRWLARSDGLDDYLDRPGVPMRNARDHAQPGVEMRLPCTSVRVKVSIRAGFEYRRSPIAGSLATLSEADLRAVCNSEH
jgi:hypothetical protein